MIACLAILYACAWNVLFMHSFILFLYPLCVLIKFYIPGACEIDKKLI
jgi:hypothetical protein